VAITVFPVTESFVAEIGDVDLTARLSSEDLEAIKQAFWSYAVLVFPEQKLEAEHQLEFAKLFGPLEHRLGAIASGPGGTRSEIVDVSNLTPKGEIWGEESRARKFQLANRLWHTDSSFNRVPALCSLLYARSGPPIGGHTEFADQRAAYDALPDARKRELAGLVAEHCMAYSRGIDVWAEDADRAAGTQFGDPASEAVSRILQPVPQMLVRTIPESGRESLYLASHAGRIRGMPDAEARTLLGELISHTTQRQFVYVHRWRVGDLVMWDNRCTMHRGRDFDDLRFVRDMQRATVSDIANTCEQAGVPVG
jgi:alpha-ketoglutarate-dependent 2,4-dichlorophenoxyacetate dioxygenase